MLSSNKDFGPFNEDHGMIVVDMQKDMVDAVSHDFFEAGLEDLRPYIDVLVAHIAEQVFTCTSHGGEVIIIEYNGHGTTYAKIKNAAHRGYQKRHGSNPPKTGAYQVFQKFSEGLWYKNPQSAEIQDFFRMRALHAKRYTTSGISTGECILSVANELSTFGIRTRVLAGLTMRATYDANSIREVKKLPWKHRDIFQIPAGAKPLQQHYGGPNLLDYLTNFPNGKPQKG